MSKLLWKSLLISPIAVGVTALSSSAIADEIQTNEVQTQPETTLESDGTDTSDFSAFSQVTSVSQLADVQPTDWAFQALQSLVERYGCIAGYPDGSFKGNRALSRYEFAAGVNACLDRVNELIAAGTTGLASKEDLATLQKLQAEFAAELATLRGRTDAIEARTTILEKNQFSTTTTLNGEVVVAIAGIPTGNAANGDDISSNTIVGDRVRLNFDTSFTGEDLLRTRLQATNLNAFSGTSTFTPEGDFRFAGGAFAGDNNNDIGLDALLYQFPLGGSTKITLEANAGAIDDFTNTINPFLDGDGGSGALTHFGTRNPIYYLLNNTGIGLEQKFGEKVILSLGYLANDAATPTSGSGLLKGPYGAMAQLTLQPFEQLALGLTYINAYNNDFTANGSAGSNRANLRSALANNPNLPGALAPFAGVDLPTSSNAYGVEASFQISPRFVVNGSVGYTNTRTLASLGGALPRGSLDIWNWSIGFAFPDLGKKGNLAGIIVGMEPKVTGVSRDLRSVIGKDSDTSLHIEAFYEYKFSDNIAITPGIVWLTAPDHDSSNDDVVIGTIRTTFAF